MPDTDAITGQTQLEEAPFEVRPPLNYSDLAWLAEMADGAEGEDLVMAYNNDEKRLVVEPVGEAKHAKHTIILTGIKIAAARQPKKHPVEKILLKVKDREDPIPAMVNGLDCDSVFTTRSAVRKFVRLYYDAQHLLDETHRKKLMKLMDDPNVCAVAHVHPSAHGPVKGVAPDERTKGASDLYLLAYKKISGQFVGDWVSLEQYEPSE